MNTSGDAAEQVVRLSLEGMHRLGFSTEDKDKILAAFSLKHIKVAGIFTHLCAADSLEENDVAFTNKQIGSFYKVLDWLKSSGLNIPKAHIQNIYERRAFYYGNYKNHAASCRQRPH